MIKIKPRWIKWLGENKIQRGTYAQKKEGWFKKKKK